MSTAQPFARTNMVKENLDHIYNAPTPIPYFTQLGGLDYLIPHLARPVFGTMIAERAASQREPVTVLDIGCSYGVNGALMRGGLTYDMLRDRYSSAEMNRLTREELLDYDRKYYAAWPRRHDVRIIGLDVSEAAVDYAKQSGAIDEGFAINLETHDLTREQEEVLAEVDLIVSTGCVGYVTSRTFDAVARACRRDRPAWVASFVLRMFPYNAIAASLAKQGMDTEKLTGTLFVQRRFSGQQEMDATLAALRQQKIDTSYREDNGLLYSELYVSRPQAEIEKRPLHELVGVVCGADKPWRPGVNALKPARPDYAPLRAVS